MPEVRKSVFPVHTDVFILRGRGKCNRNHRHENGGGRMTVNCISKTEGKTNCPLLIGCLARLTDPTIVACGYPLYCAGIISKSDIEVIHRVRVEE